MINTVKHYIKCMLSDCPDVSSKRVVGFGAFLVMVVMAILNVTKAAAPSDFVFNGFLILVLGCFGLNTAVDFIKVKQTGTTITQLPLPPAEAADPNIKDSGGE